MELTPPPEYHHVVFPARSNFDIAHQESNHVSGQQLLDIYLQNRNPDWMNMASSLHDDSLAKAEIRCGGMSWMLDLKILQDRLPKLLESFSKDQQLPDDDVHTVFLTTNDPGAVINLLYSVSAAEAPRTTPLQSDEDWEQIIRLWHVAYEYQADFVLNDIYAIILSSRVMSQMCSTSLVHVIKALNRASPVFYVQAAYFVKCLVSRNGNRIKAGLLDPALVKTPLVNDRVVKFLDEKIFNALTEREQEAYRNLYHFYWTSNLLRHISDYDTEKPEDWRELVALWRMALSCGYARLRRYVEREMIHTMSLRRIRNYMNLVEIIDVFIALGIGRYIASLQGRFVRKIGRECPVETNGYKFQALLSPPDALRKCRAHVSCAFNTTGSNVCECENCKREET